MHVPGRRRTVRFRRFLAGLLAAFLAAGVFGLIQATPSRTAPGQASAPAASPATPQSGAPAGASNGAAAISTASPQRGSTLDSAVDNIIDANSQYQVGVALLDLGTGELRQYGVEAPFEAASTAKILTAAAFYHSVEAGSASLDDPLGEFTAGFQLKEMVQESDNDSWSLLMDAVGTSGLVDYAASIGVSYDPDVNTLTTADMANILAQLYTGGLLDPDDTTQLLSYMQNTNYEYLIPAAVPDGVTVFHKYGLLDDELHDAAILSLSAGSYVLVIYTKGTGLGDIPQRTVVIHDITQAVTSALS
jgi:beta-lactamase class A